MKIEKGNYIRAAEFSNEEIDVFIGLTGIDLNNSGNHSELFSQRWECYGLDGGGNLVNWNNPQSYGDYYTDHKDITQEFRYYIDALSVEKKDDEWAHTYSDYGVRKDCILIHDKPDIHGQVLVLNRCGEYVLTGTVELKPIKQTIKPSAAWSLVSEKGWSMHEVNEKYDVVEKD